ncbi:MAG: hypothetical protein R3B90_17830 [Planctomycetaceae bacterium]
MIGTVLLTVAVLGAPLDAPAATTTRANPSLFHRAIAGNEVTVRGQSAEFTGPVLGIPEEITTYYQAPTYSPNGVTPSYVDPSFGNVVPPGYGGATPGYAPQFNSTDPFLNGGVAPYGAGGYGGTPYPGTAPGVYTFGLNGPQPYGVGWVEKFNFGFTAETGTNRGGKFGTFEFDYIKELALPVANGWVFVAEPQYNLRLFNGPEVPSVTPGNAYPMAGGSLLASPELPGDVHRFGLGLKLRSPNVGGWIFEAGFNPALATDFERTLTSDAWMFDGHLAAFLQLNQRWMGAIGVAYWDRVDDIVLPYAGVVWTPNDYFEARLLFPKPRVSLFLGTPMGVATWFYVEGEYRVEAYQVDINGRSAVDTNANGLVSANELRNLGATRAQLEEWRVVGGLYMEGPMVTGFVEAGAAISREVKYDSAVQSFEPDSGFIFRTGIRF